jgi:hypothetical protein
VNAYAKQQSSEAMDTLKATIFLYFMVARTSLRGRSRGRHPTVAHELVELASGNADVHRGLLARKAAARDRANGGMVTVQRIAREMADRPCDRLSAAA